MASHAKLEAAKSAFQVLTPARVMLGLILLGIAAGIAHGLQSSIADNARMYATEINISSRQQALSQHTALLSQMMANSRNKQERSRIRRQLRQAIDLMERSHNALTHGNADIKLTGNLSSAMRSLYFNQPLELDIKMRNYLTDLKTLLRTPENGYSQQALIAQEIGDSSLALLPLLDTVVKQYEQESMLGLSHRLRETSSLLFALILLGTVTFPLFALYIIIKKRSEKELRLSAQVINSSPEGVIITDISGNIQRINPAFTRMIGYEADEVIGKNTRILQSGKHSPEFYRDMWDSLHTLGVWQGEIWKRCKDGSLVPTWQSIAAIRDVRGKVIHYTAVFSNISQQKKVEKDLRHQTRHDALTRLPNRVLFLEFLEHGLRFAKRKKLPIAVMLLDLDRFKIINDTLGHTVGDELLKAVAKRLKSCIRESDMVARLGGDEFTVVLPEIAREEDAAYVGEKILASFRDPFLLAGKEIFVTTSIGISLYPSDGDDMETLIKHADEAMYQAKEEGKNRFHIYTEKLNARAHERLELETAMRGALDRKEFKVYYQPQVDAITGLITGAEALVRWQRPGLGLVSPIDFIPLAEETGLIVPIGEWVLYQACAQMKAWQDEGLPVCRIGVNLSARQLQQKDLLETVERVLSETGLHPELLDIEITESVAMNDAEAAICTMQAINDMGVYISVDDFGIGYSSLSYLKRLPIHTLKIDRSFIKDITFDQDDATIVHAILSMAKSLGLSSVAEGVETKDQLLLLRANGCNVIQGFMIGKPMPADDFRQLLVHPTLPWLTGWPHTSNQDFDAGIDTLPVQSPIRLVKPKQRVGFHQA